MTRVDKQALLEGLKNVLVEQLSNCQDLPAARSARIKSSISVVADSNSLQLGESLGESLVKVLSGAQNSVYSGTEHIKGGH